MSFSNSITTAVDNIIFSYIAKVANKYSIDKTELMNLYTDNSVPVTSPSVGTSELNKLSKSELIELCRTKKLKVTGSKVDLIQRLLDVEKVVEKVEIKEEPKITTKLINKISPIQIGRNKFGNFEHTETKFVFNNATQKVYGKQLQDGSIGQLTEEDINICNKYKFTYELPMNLNSINDKVELAELEEEDDEEEVEVEIEEDDEEVEEEEEIEIEDYE